MNITEFLLARIAADEVAARKLALTDRRPLLSVAATVNHPARVLAECTAKRVIVGLWEADPDDSGFVYESVDAGYEIAVNQVVRALATVYADHPEYQQEWGVGAR